MSSTILVLNGHPDPANKGLCQALAEAYAQGARDGGHDVRRLDVAALDFPLLRSQAEFETAVPPPAIAAAQEHMRWANHLVVIFPLWLGDMPAVLKGFLEQVLRPGFAFSYRPNGFPVRHLAGRSARVVVTMGMPALIYRWYFRAHGLKNLERNILGFVGFSPIRDTIVGSIGTRGQESLRRVLDEVKAMGRRAA
ncbi:MAG: NAD(P)H-dependent oxidoreductase [Alphaproteobacteria bacterium]|nr:NAD(P)H-dependent oxidoreductase [Alphaproteobacteria bacterium]